MSGRALSEMMQVKDVVSRRKDPVTGKVTDEELECGHWIDVRCLTKGSLRRRCPMCLTPKKRSR